ncbi:hypothetical protein PspLS_06426 [Pyricularia sp. CBS 133598]|nr:hypothetical protein PspLS_06426 [Pyricularia sp. CBS 133598]
MDIVSPTFLKQSRRAESIQVWSMPKLNAKITGSPVTGAAGQGGMTPGMNTDNTLKTGNKRPNPRTPVVSSSNLPPAAKRLETTAGGVPAQKTRTHTPKR